MKCHKINQRGDTIIEVLISIAIISLVLTVSYATTNHNARTIQDAQERTQAQQLAQRQLEFLKANTAAISGKDCYDANGLGQNAVLDDPFHDPCTQQANGTGIPSATFEPAYTVNVNHDTALDRYIVSIRWDSLLNSAKDNVVLYYRP